MQRNVNKFLTNVKRKCLENAEVVGIERQYTSTSKSITMKYVHTRVRDDIIACMICVSRSVITIVDIFFLMYRSHQSRSP